MCVYIYKGTVGECDSSHSVPSLMRGIGGKLSTSSQRYSIIIERLAKHLRFMPTVAQSEAASLRMPWRDDGRACPDGSGL